HRDTYLLLVGSGFAAYLGFWSIAANMLMRGDSAPVPYLPLLNPLDGAQAFLLFALTRHLLLMRGAYPKRLLAHQRAVVMSLVLVAFIALNGALLRTL